VSIETISRRYATALADVVVSSGETDTVKAELKSWEALINSNAELHDVLGNPAIVFASKERVLDELIKKTGPTRTTANFLKILLKNGRLTEIAEINDRFESVLQERSGVLSAEVYSARELADAQRSELKHSLERLTGKRLNINFGIDENIIGGVVTRIGSTVYDGSVKTQLENLKQQLVNG
jgi:F-type H+-transporting ATPase subunit delta